MTREEQVTKAIGEDSGITCEYVRPRPRKRDAALPSLWDDDHCPLCKSPAFSKTSKLYIPLIAKLNSKATGDGFLARVHPACLW